MVRPRMTAHVQNVGRTAFVIAYCRMRETESPTPLFSDHLAHLFLDQDTEETAKSIAQLAHSTEHLVSYRTCYFDRQLMKQLENKVKQVVIVGAGLDTRAIRFDVPGVQFYEIDEGSVIDFKRTRLESHGYTVNSRLVSCNYLRENWIDLLVSQGFDLSVRTYIIWEGNSMYIAESDIVRLMTSMLQQIADFAVSFDYITNRLLKSLVPIGGSQRLLQGFSDLGAPWITGFDQITTLLAPVGLRMIEDHLLVEWGQQYRHDRRLDPRVFSYYRICTAGV